MGWGSDARAAGKSGDDEVGKGGHAKKGAPDKGRGGNIDKHGRTGKHHGGFLSGSSKKGDGLNEFGRKPGSFAAWLNDDHKKGGNAKGK